jgi:DEAD/DEAH box helicase domain-containing protein
MATVIDLLRRLGQRPATEGGNALVAHFMVPGATLSRVSPPTSHALADAWSSLVERPTLRHHALAISTARNKQSIALIGHGDQPHDDLILPALERLEQQHTLLYVVPPTDRTIREQLMSMANALQYTVLDSDKVGARIQPAAIVIATPDSLHGRILRYHDRAWRWLWPRLSMVALPYLHRYNPVQAGHLHWLLRRIERLTRHVPLQLFTALAPIANVDQVISVVLERSIRCIDVPTKPPLNTIAALWRSDHNRVATAVNLARQLKKHQLLVTIIGRDFEETAQVQAEAASEITAMLPPSEARVAIVTGIPQMEDARQALMHAGYRLLIMLTADEPHELFFAAAPEELGQWQVHWPVALASPYIGSIQLACASAERPLEESEIEHWKVETLRDQLYISSVLQPLPDENLWQHAPDADAPYSTSTLSTTDSDVIRVFDPENHQIGFLPAVLLDHYANVGQVFMPGWRVSRRDDEQRLIQLEPDLEARATIVRAETTVQIREEMSARSVRVGTNTIKLYKGRVMATRRIMELQNLLADGSGQRIRISRPQQIQWSATACWFDLPIPPSDPSTAGWVLAQTLPLFALSRPNALITAYDPDHQRLYLLEVEPGDVGIVTIMYNQCEMMLKLAPRLLQACAGHALYHQLAATEADWLEPLLKSVPRRSKARSRSARGATETPAPSVDTADQESTVSGLEAQVAPQPMELLSEPALPLDSQPQDQSEAVMDHEPEHELPQRLGHKMPHQPADMVEESESQSAQALEQTSTDTVQEYEHQREPVVQGIDQTSNRGVPQYAIPVPTGNEQEPAMIEAAETLEQTADELSGINKSRSVVPQAEKEPEPEIKPAKQTMRERPLAKDRASSQTQKGRSIPKHGKQEPTRSQRIPHDRATQPPTQSEKPRASDSSPYETARRPTRERTSPTRVSQQQPRPQATAPRTEDSPTPVESTPDVNAMIMRMRRMREAQQPTRPQLQQHPQVPVEGVEPRFEPGERVQCLPYGIGNVRSSRVIEGREYVTIDFEEYGEIEVDASLSLIRSMSAEPSKRADDNEQ